MNDEREISLASAQRSRLPPPNTFAKPASVRSACATRHRTIVRPRSTHSPPRTARRCRNRPRVGFVEARQIYAYAPGAIYQLYASPNFVSAILLEPGESLNAIAAGDTSRWMVTQSEGETDKEPRTIVLVKPHASEFKTNIVLITDRRTYTIEARAMAGSTYSSEIAWTYRSRRRRNPPRSGRPHGLSHPRHAREQPHWMPTRVVR